MEAVIGGGNETRRATPAAGGGDLVAIFEERASTFADRIAVTGPDGRLTYGELDARADVLATRLAAAGAGPGDVVALLAERTTAMVVGLLGILKAGAAYLPLDPGLPEARARWLVADADAVAVATVPSLAPTLAGAAPVVVVDGDGEGDGDPAVGPRPVLDRSRHLAYVVYTSGSTGAPKGVMVEHASVVRLFESTRPWFGFDEHDVWTLFHSIAFDFSVWELWGALLHGGRVVIVPSDVARAPQRLADLLAAEGVTVLNQTPSAFRGLAAVAGDLPALRLVVFGGERLDVRILGGWLAARGDRHPRLVNMYGITETTVHASYRPVGLADLARPAVSPIGVPLPDLRFAVVDEGGRLVADGEPGELYVAGPALARAYLGRDDLTRERFGPLPAAGPGRWYRTGDRVARQPGGDHVYLGRVDDQLKVRGYRVEPREVEAVLEDHPAVDAAIVAAADHGEGDVRLVAHVVPVAGTDWEQARGALAAHAAARLPAHLLPSSYRRLATLPLTANGKVDRAAVAAAPAGAGPSAGGPVADLSPTEARIAAVWCDVLAVGAVGADDDFFELGGTSLALVRMIQRVTSDFEVDLDLTMLLDGVTVGALAAGVDAVVAGR